VAGAIANPHSKTDTQPYSFNFMAVPPGSAFVSSLAPRAIETLRQSVVNSIPWRVETNSMRNFESNPVMLTARVDFAEHGDIGY
jgi:hypothetical protein